MTYVDRTFNCVDCGVEFIHSAADQEYYVQKGFASDPKRCTSCRASRRAAREARLRRPGHRRAARLRARRRPRRPRVLRGDLLLVRQPGAGAVQPAHGPTGLLLRLLPDRPARLTANPGLEPEDLAGAEPLAPASVPDRHARGPVDLPTAVATDDRGVLVDPETTEPRGAWRTINADERLRPRVVVRDHR